MITSLPNGITPLQFISRAFWLMYQAAGGEFGMGMLQRLHAPTERSVFDVLLGNRDYTGEPGGHNGKKGDLIYGDYVAGRMIKFGFKIVDDHTVECREGPLDPEYQAWARQYRTPADLVEAILTSLQSSKGG